MLTLYEDWRRRTHGSTVRSLLRQADALGEYPAAARLLMRACMELLRDTRLRQPEDGGPVIHFQERVIRINHHAWLIADRVDDEVIRQVTAVCAVASDVRVIAPPGSREVLTRALSRGAPRYVTVEGLDGYVDMRTFFSSADLGTDPNAVFADLLLRYCDLCAAYHLPHLMVPTRGLSRLPGTPTTMVQPPSLAATAPVDCSSPLSDALKRRHRWDAAAADDDDDDGDDADEQESCEFCGCVLDESGDNWDGLCPECAGAISAVMDRLDASDEDRDRIVTALLDLTPRTPRRRQ